MAGSSGRGQEGDTGDGWDSMSNSRAGAILLTFIFLYSKRIDVASLPGTLRKGTWLASRPNMAVSQELLTPRDSALHVR